MQDKNLQQDIRVNCNASHTKAYSCRPPSVLCAQVYISIYLSITHTHRNNGLILITHLNVGLLTEAF